MAVKLTDIPALLVERIESAYPAPALFSAVETDDWPEGTLSHLQACGILRYAQRAEVVVCPGCSWQCHKLVVVRSTGTSTGRQAFIVCDEDPDHGRQPVTARSLDQYGATIDGLSAYLAGVVGRKPLASSRHGTSFLLGTVKGRHGSRDVSICLIEGRLFLWVGQHHESLVDTLSWTGDRLLVDMAFVRRLAHRKEPPLRLKAARESDRTRQRARAREKQTRNEAIFREATSRRSAKAGSWSAIASAIAATELAETDRGARLSAATVRRIITEARRRERENFRSDRKTHN
jgi:hypothetical protein